MVHDATQMTLRVYGEAQQTRMVRDATQQLRRGNNGLFHLLASCLPSVHAPFRPLTVRVIPTGPTQRQYTEQWIVNMVKDRSIP